MADPIIKSYEYKFYRGTTYLGSLSNEVISDYSCAQDINSNAVRLGVEVALQADIADLPSEALLDEDGNQLLDEDGNVLYDEGAQDVVSSLNPSALIQENNTVKVYEYSTDNPNGKIAFDGWIEDWEADFDNDKVSFLAINKAVDMADYLIEGASIVDQSQLIQNDSLVINDTSLGPKSSAWARYGQTFKPTASSISSIKLKLKNFSTYPGQMVYVSIIDGFTGAYGVGTTLGTTSRFIDASDFTDFIFTFDTPISVTPGTTYFMFVNSLLMDIALQNTGNVYANGGVWDNFYGGAGPAGPWSSATFAGYDFYFETYYTGGATSTPLLNMEVATMLTTIIDSYAAAGGNANYIAGSVDTTGLTPDYTFKVNTVLEGVQKCKDLAPSDWYWYVDPGTQVLYFKQTPTTPTHTFYKGKHYSSFKIGATVQNVRNIVYFTGGLITTTNLFSKYTNTASIATNLRRRLDRISDNRVTTQDTADLIANNFLDQNAGVVYSSPITVLASDYDISTIKVGDTVALSGNGNFADTLTLQIARTTKRPDSIDIVLGVVLERGSDALSKALNDLDKLQTVDNPSTPS